MWVLPCHACRRVEMLRQRVGVLEVAECASHDDLGSLLQQSAHVAHLIGKCVAQDGATEPDDGKLHDEAVGEYAKKQNQLPHGRSLASNRCAGDNEHEEHLSTDHTEHDHGIEVLP